MVSVLKKRLRHILAWGWVWLALPATGQMGGVQPYSPVHPDPVLEPWRWTVFPELEGLGLQAMAEAKDGAMWFGVDDGAMRYDGVDWMLFSPEDGLFGAPVVALCAAQDGSVYAGTPLGVSRFSDGRWKRVFPPEGDLPWPVARLKEARNGRVWASTYWGALQLGFDEFALYTAPSVSAVLQGLAPYVRLYPVPDHAASVDSRHEGIGVSVVQGFIWRVAPEGPAATAGIQAGDRIVAVDGGSHFPAIIEGLLFSEMQRRVDGPAGTPVTLTVVREGFPDPFDVTVQRERVGITSRDFQVTDVLEARDGSLWFGLAAGEILRGHARTWPGEARGEWTWFTEQDGLDIGEGPRLFQTHDGDIWAIFRGRRTEINRFDGQAWTHFSLHHLRGYSDLHHAIRQSADGTLWIGGHWGSLLVFRNREWMCYRPSAEVPLPNERLIEILETSDGAMWIAGRRQAAVRLDIGPSQWRTYDGLRYQCETPDGSMWFVSQDSSVVRRHGTSWSRYTTKDGLMEGPLRLFPAGDGKLWAVGSHDQAAATAQFDGRKWSVQTHPEVAQALGVSIHRSQYTASDGSLWFSGSAALGIDQPGGILHFEGKAWIHHAPPEVPGLVYAIGGTPDGALWVGGRGLHRFCGEKWTAITEPVGLASWIHDILATRNGDLWVGTRSDGVFRFDGRTWKQYGLRDGLESNRIWWRGLSEAPDGSIWVLGSEGASRFDGQTWFRNALPPGLTRGYIQESTDGMVWFIHSVEWKSIRYKPDAIPPETEIGLSAKVVSQPGNTVLAWKGLDPWRSTPHEYLQYSWRLNGASWSVFSSETYKTFLELPAGKYAFEVRARDRDFNVDPTPAIAHFSVVPPLWRQPWFIALISTLISAVLFQTGRVVIRDRRLRAANEALSDANRALFNANREIQTQTERKSSFLASMSHELRTPMNAIKGFTSLVLRREPTLSERGKANLEKVGQASDHLLALINDLLDLSKIEAGRMEVHPTRFDVGQLLASCCETINPLVREGVSLSCACEGVAQAHTDEARVRQMVINLLSNAVKFTHGGEVAVGARVYGEEGALGRQMLEISVRDTGVGIPPEKLEGIFEEFVQAPNPSGTAQKGTGLGLSITKKFAELLGGRICVWSDVGTGSTFAIHIPLEHTQSNART